MFQILVSSILRSGFLGQLAVTSGAILFIAGIYLAIKRDFGRRALLFFAGSFLPVILGLAGTIWGYYNTNSFLKSCPKDILEANRDIISAQFRQSWLAVKVGITFAIPGVLVGIYPLLQRSRSRVKGNR